MFEGKSLSWGEGGRESSRYWNSGGSSACSVRQLQEQ